MKNSFKKLTAFALIFLSLALFTSCSEEIKVNQNEEEILKEMPDIKITEEDKKLEEFIFNLEGLKDKKDDFTIESEEAEILLKDFLKDGEKAGKISKIKAVIYLDIFKSPEKRVSFGFNTSDGKITKIIGIYEIENEDKKCRVIYQNDGEIITKEN